MINFNESKTRENLMKAFAGESQARNRYNFAAEQAAEQGLYVVEAVFKFTADQECAHAKVFYDFLSELSGENITVYGSYPVNITNSVAELLRFAEHNENEEYADVYRSFGETAREEGFAEIAAKFEKIAEVEKTHAERFSRFAEGLEKSTLFVSDVKCEWMCLNCGTILNVTQAPPVCPVCNHEKGYFIRLELAPYTAR